ncbi:DUF6297 family protein [Catellatospora tritici]|uniref:DUF6297 family protein n=1 Tax=Catellatospora tritici TaxID=2851566 RepID=UPI001C2DE273|nr:DUF6297 family protein [Catellatospora tritici]MBV1850824.1 hypothetical protein [Catellatospora tritici]MBV1851077.1 hypothetical protein [Catellatospora tritici]
MSSVGQVRALVRAGRRRPGWTDWYLLLAAVVIGSLLVGGPLGEVLGRSVPPLPPYRAAALLSLVAAGGAALVAVALAVGPVALSPADAYWLVLSPLDRRAVLTRAVAVVGALAVVVGGLGGVLVRWAAGLPAYGWGPVGVAALVGAAVAVCVAGLSVLAQAARLGALVRRVAVGAGVAAVGFGSAAAVWPGWSGWSGAGSLVVSGPGLLVVAVAALVVAALVVAALVWWRLAVFPAGAVLAASVRWGVVTDAAVGLEPSFVSRVVEDGFWRGRVLRSRPWPGWLPVWAAPAWQDWRMLGRRPHRLVVSLVGAAVPGVLAVAVGGLRLLVAGVLLAGAVSAASAGASGVRRDAGSAVLGRLFGVGGVAVASARLVLPGVLAAGWLVAASAVLVAVGVWGSWWWLVFGVAVAPVLAVGVLRLAGRGWVDHASVPVVMPQSGSWVPTGWIVWWVTGWDVVVAGGLPSVWVWSGGSGDRVLLFGVQVLVGAVVVWGWVRAGSRRGRG